MTPDYLIVGSGLTGAVIARTLVDHGMTVEVWERRSHVGGNVHDHIHPSGIRVHTYGPHYFRTNSEALWRFVNRFATFYKYEPELRTHVDGQLERWPITASYLRRAVGPNWKPSFEGQPKNFEEASLAMMPRQIYDKFIKGYTEKQWGVAATRLSASLAKRFDVREDDETRLMRHKHQGIPVDGYAEMMRNMLDGIPVRLNRDFAANRSQAKYRKMLVYTGPIDAFYNHEYGKLEYRGQNRKERWVGDIEFVQPCGQVNDPGDDTSHIRTLEWKHMMQPGEAASIRGTLLTSEEPISPTDLDQFEYPFPDSRNARLYDQYRVRSQFESNVLICGRLGEYRYYDMDQAIGRALQLTQKILQRAYADSPLPRSSSRYRERCA